jgi:hypothetical protein
MGMTCQGPFLLKLLRNWQSGKAVIQAREEISRQTRVDLLESQEIRWGIGGFETFRGTEKY